MNRETFQKTYGILGESPEIKEIVDIVQQVSQTDLTVLITGESGSGKEVIARAIFNNSNRSNENLITVNCGAIPEGILESELFGHQKGAYTGAIEARKGYFELANGGTIFLDEIGELQPATQVKFLRVLENGEFMRVGSSETIKVNVRVIAATNKNLEYEMEQGKFRADLYYRLRTINIKIPPLRKRKEDIPILFDKFVEDTCKKNKVFFKGISKEASALLLNYKWPGNVRELRNVVESLVLLENDDIIEENDILKYIHLQPDQIVDRNLPVFLNKSTDQAERELIIRALLELKSNIMEMKNLMLAFMQQRSLLPAQNIIANNDVRTLKEIEKQTILSNLEKSNYNRRMAAKSLGISERTLYRKMKEYDLDEKNHKFEEDREIKY